MSKQVTTRSRSLNEMQKAFINYLVYEGKNPTESARLAGYSHPKQSAYVLTRTPSIMTNIQQTRQRIYQTDLPSLAIATLKSVMLDPDAPSGSRVQASRTALELAGDLGSKSENDINTRKHSSRGMRARRHMSRNEIQKLCGCIWVNGRKTRFIYHSHNNSCPW